MSVGVSRPSPGALVLTYLVTGLTGNLRLPPSTAPTRTDELWRTTCLEVFIRAGSGAEYYEFNFAPSTQWAAYRFTGYREGMSAPNAIRPPRTDVTVAAQNFELKAVLDLQLIPTNAPWHLALSAVIEEANGRKSYWALAHPPGKPDFHHPDGFALELPTA
ncbi:MAG: DOMON-like domain-containing protein [Alphaproteobacteria bacterium]|nr:DOMON-like domain-containing protein [Alphaproteobacteria bacterium]